MVRYFAAFFALLSFAGAFVVGVLAHVPPVHRLARSGVALAVGLLAGAGAGLVVQRVVLRKLAEGLAAQKEEEQA